MLHVDLVFDIGANEGQFAEELLKAGFSGKVVSFEPLPAEWDILLSRSKSWKSWDVCPRCALGDSDGEIDIHVAGNSQSSSVLPMETAHLTAAPESRYVRTEKVPLRRFSVAAQPWLGSGSRYCIKLDVQGFEDPVIEGMGDHFAHATVVLRELSLTPMYRGEPLLEAAIQQMRNAGFTPWAIDPVFLNRETGQLLQVEMTFIRES
jgi:FkbM family methyltransferase